MPKPRKLPPGAPPSGPGVPRSRTGIKGLDEVTNGGLPLGRPTLVCGAAGCGKTLLATEFLVRGAMDFGEPGVFMTFEEKPEDLATNVLSLGFDLPKLVSQKKLSIDHVRVERNEIEETGEYDLEGLFVRLGHAIDSIQAERVVLDPIESLFAGLSNESVLRAELRRLFHWLKDKGVTAVITGERGEATLTRQGLEEYVSDCVILLDHRVTDQVYTRRLRVVKYRGSTHGTNEYPFLIDEDGISVVPITSLGLEHKASNERVSTGVPRLDTMLGGTGYYRGSSVLVTGTAGTGKSSLAASFAHAACGRGEKALYFAFEESQSQITRNMRSIGIDLEPWAKKGLLRFHVARPTLYGLEMHLATMYKEVEQFKPAVAVVDPITSLLMAGSRAEIQAMMMRLVDHLKGAGITALFTSLTLGGTSLEQTDFGVSSLVDTWLNLRDIESGGERNRALHVLKSRGMAHSNQIREFLLTGHGIELVDVYTGSGQVLAGSARLAQETQERESDLRLAQEAERRRRDLDRKRKAMEARIEAMRAEFEAEAAEAAEGAGEEARRGLLSTEERERMMRMRKADVPSDGPARRARNGKAARGRAAN
jgi:circadian clock protein KaiC